VLLLSFSRQSTCTPAVNSLHCSNLTTRRWLDVPTSETTSLVDYVAADRGRVADGPPPQLPCELYSLAFRLRHGGTVRGPLVGETTAEDRAAISESNNLREYVAHLRSVSEGRGRIQEQPKLPQAPSAAPESNADQEALVRVSSEPSTASAHRKRSSVRKKSRSGASAAPVLGMCGFTSDECSLLLSRGCKPWDEDAETVLRELRAAPDGTPV